MVAAFVTVETDQHSSAMAQAFGATSDAEAAESKLIGYFLKVRGQANSKSNLTSQCPLR